MGYMSMNKQITTRTNPAKILKLFRDCKITESVNLKTSFGYVYLCGGILSKLEGSDHYLAIKGNWVLQ